jgi:hypothetical protein
MTALAAPARRTSSYVVDGVTLLAVVACIPFVILGIGLPIALAIKLVLWIVALL